MGMVEMMNKNVVSSPIQFSTKDLGEEVGNRLTVDAIAKGDPILTLIMGPVCSGKTTLRRKQFSHSFVLIDASQLFIDLGGVEHDFPSSLEQPMLFIGSEVSRRAVALRMNIVTELIGAEIGPVVELIDAMKGIGYRINVVGVNAELGICLERESNRSDDNISAFYAEQYQMNWLLSAARGFKH